MDIPQTNFEPPFDVTRASHLVLTSRDLAASREFYVEVLGLVVSDEDSKTIYFRGVEERCHHSLTIKQSAGTPSCERIGFRVFRDADLERAKHYFDANGVPARWVDVPHQGRTLHVSDPMGTPLEFCASMETRPRVQTLVHTHKGAAALRMDHYQVLAPEIERNTKFYADIGFRVSDYITVQKTEAIVGMFLYRKDNPHDLVFLNRSGPLYHHCGYIVYDMYSMIKACDVAGNLGFGDNVEFGPGRHGLGHSYYTYLRDPDGHRTELLLPAVQMGDIDDKPTRWDVSPEFTGELWGLPPQRSWMLEATPFAGVDVQVPTAEGEPMTLERYLALKQHGFNANENRPEQQMADA
jgi:catechol 2,3-dioxygenase